MPDALLVSPIPTLWPQEPPRFSGGATIDAFLRWCHEMGATDINFKSNDRIRIRRRARWDYATLAPMDSVAMTDALNHFYRSPSGAIEIQKITDIDGRHEVKISRDEAIPFRWNATRILSEGSDGLEISIRRLPLEIPTAERLKIAPEILDALHQRQGIILITGVTGSGKSTTAAAFLRFMVEVLNVGKILTYEHPIEYRFDLISNAQSWVSQSEIGLHLPSFEHGVANSLRRLPEVIFIGEMRDLATITAAITAARTGHLVIGTTHTMGVASTINRLVRSVPADEREQVAYDLADMMRLVVSQALVASPKEPGITAVREHLVFTEELRDRILGEENTRLWQGIVRKLVKTHGLSMTQAANNALAAGDIYPEDHAELTDAKETADAA